MYRYIVYIYSITHTYRTSKIHNTVCLYIYDINDIKTIHSIKCICIFIHDIHAYMYVSITL